MRKLLVLAWTLILGLGASWAQAKVAASPTPEVQTDVVLDKDSGLDLSLYSGADYSFMGDFSTGTKNLAKYITDNGGDMLAHTANWGWDSGLDLGLNLDPSDRISIGFEDVLTQSLEAIGTDGSAGIGDVISPNLIDATLNYKLSVSEGKSSKTTFSLGFGYYHAFVDVNVGLASQNIYGTFTGDTVGGTLGVGQDWAVGSGFDFEVSAKGRYAVFDRLSTDTIHGASLAPPYTMAMVPVSGGNVVLLPQAQSTLDSNPSEHPAKLDYCGVDAAVALHYHF